MGAAETKQETKGISLPDWAILLVILTFLAYLPALRAGFIWDDGVLITENPMIKASDGLRRFWLTTQAPDYYPLTESLWWLEWRAWGRSATGYHVVNILLHAVNAVLVWTVLRRLKIPGAWLAGLIFAVHPVNAATVAWVSEQKNTLSMLLYAVAILLYLRFDEEGRWPRQGTCRGWCWYGWSLVAFLLALLSKTAVVMLPVVLLGCVWWRRGRVGWKDVLYSVPFFALSLVLGLVTIWYQYRLAPLGAGLAAGERVVGTDDFAFRLAAAGRDPWFYLCKAVLPLNLMAIYPKWQIDASRGVAYAPGALLVVCFLVCWWKRRTWGRALLFGLGYFVVMLFPVLGLLKQGPNRLTFIADRFDHWQYYSIVGAIALAVAGGQAVCRRMGNRWPSLGTAAAVVVVSVLGAGTWQRGRVYVAEETFWRDTLAKNPQASVAYLNLGEELIKMGQTDDAIRNYREALRINPDFVEARHNLGSALLQLHQVPEAIEQLEQALRINPNFVDAHNALGTALLLDGRVPEAMGHWEEALRLKPDSADVHNNLGSALLEDGKVSAAIGHYEEALRINPDYADAHYNLANALLRQGKIPEAIEHYQQALLIKPDFAQAQNALARLQAGQ